MTERDLESRPVPPAKKGGVNFQAVSNSKKRAAWIR
jgi:hypothetical protein